MCGALLLFILVDVLGHKFLKVSCTIVHWVLLVVQVASTAVTGVMGIRSLKGTQDQRDSNPYMAYRYLQSGEGVNVQEKADLCPDVPKGHDKLISLFAEAVDGDYIGAILRIPVCWKTARWMPLCNPACKKCRISQPKCWDSTKKAPKSFLW